MRHNEGMQSLPTEPQQAFHDPSPGEDDSRPDGRRIRAQANRGRIVRAVVDLVGRNQFEPTAEAIAAEAGVSLRTVFRHFEEMENLYLEVAAVIFERALPAIDAPFPQGLDARGTALAMLDRRIALFEMVAPYTRALDIFRHRSTALAESHRRVGDLSRSVLLSRLSPECRADQELVELLDLLLGLESWSRLRDAQGLSVAEAREVLARAITALF